MYHLPGDSLTYTRVTKVTIPHARREGVISYLLHPGYEIMKHLLTDTPLLQLLLSSLVQGLQSFDMGIARGNPAFVFTIVRLLRIIHRTLEIQDHFLDILIPLLSETDVSSVTGTTHSRSFFTRFDQALTFGADFVPAIAAYTSIDPYCHGELGLLSVKILTILSSSPVSSNATALIERSEHSLRILNGISNILAADTFDDPNDAVLLAEESSGAGASDVRQVQTFPQAVRMAILDLFLRNTTPDSRYPNIAHFFFFGEGDQWSPRSGGRVLLRLVSDGVPLLADQARHFDVLPLFIRLPTLAERCYRVIYQLCVHPKSPQYLMRDLRTEDFFARQLAAVPVIAPEAENETFIEVLYPDGTRIVSTPSRFASFLQLRSWILDLAALDLHFLTNGRFGAKVSELLNVLFGTGSALRGQDFHEVGQSRMRIIEIVQSLSFDWADSLALPPCQLNYFANLDLSSCTTRDGTGNEFIDRNSLLLALAAAKRSLQLEGRITTDVHHKELEDEKSYILQSCTVENNRRSIQQATSFAYESWRRVLDVTLTKCFSRLPSHHRENVLFDLLSTLPPIITSQETAESTTVLLSETILSCMTKLREDRRQKVTSESSVLPAERLQAILRTILNCLLEGNRAEPVRGNLYAVLINFLQLIHPTHPQHPPKDIPIDLTASRSLVHSQRSPSETSLIANCFSMMKNTLDKLATTVSRDAIDGTEVWRTVAFMLLDSLARLSAHERQHPLLTSLVRHGVLDNFIRSLKDSDERLQSILRPDPGGVFAMHSPRNC